MIGNRRFIVAALLAISEIVYGPPAQAANNVTLIPVTSSAYGANDINSCAIDHDNIITNGDYQYIAYYGSVSRGYAPLMLARRDLTVPGSAFSLLNTGLNISQSGNSNGNTLSDDHNVIAMGIDSNGLMHLAWGMHNTPLSNSTGAGYYISDAAVNGSAWSSASIQFTKQTSLVSGGPNENEVTYPDFLNLPGSDTLLFSYRQGGAGGGSGNGDQYFDRYNPATGTFTQTRVLDGMDDNINAYLNNLTYDSNGNLLMSWTWRSTPNWQTNSNIMFAQSPDNGVSWFQQGGDVSYTLPIRRSSGETIWPLPQNTSFINQTSMTVDQDDNPIIATYWAPGTNGTTNANQPVSSVNNPNLQYMLVYYDGTQWRTSQVSDRTSDTTFDTGGGYVRDLGRPIVMTDREGRVLVVTRSEDTGQGSYSNPSTVGNDIVVYYNTTTSLDSDDPAPWQTVTLDSANMGDYEPTYDSTRWATDNILDLFYEPEGLSGENTGAVSVLEWDEQAYFKPIMGDTNSDGKVNLADYDTILANFGKHVTNEYAGGDLNGDGIVNADDWALFTEGLAEYDASSGQSVPEPGAALGFAGLFLLLWRKNARGALRIESADGSTASKLAG